ncbi:Arf-GAP with Rho-GAP domain, ANK repeat and PH domain-containing protein 1 [Labeo rohita]|uniref:Arf-GAP with Rho-GAP domain, ANK repeat and PH domain-containing protein 1 n=1 Tax=Labeo rohita TaxID=84645 RepID=A0ABQ8MPN8_LABRO|nr:Arf-GAP with Rho-GAP domain, ANK repeat and PH domain-containing protein 1 [Labeo rohita]
MQKCFINLKAEEDRKETVNWREREDSIDIQCTDFPDFSEDFRQIVKAGWLEKTPPKGGKIYQRRWVQLDSEYLRYFQSIKEVYSKRMVSLGSVDKVVSVGDLRFELRSQSRTFLFRAESTQERNDWVCCIEKILSDRKQHLEPRNLFFRNGSVNISFEGYMEMLSPRTKVYTLISKDKLFIFKSHEEYFQGVGITDIDMRMANVRDGENKRSFTLTTPFMVDSESEKQRWCEALTECVSRALSCEGLCESIWRVPSNRLCADCSSSMPEWASINLCVLLCEKCAGAHRSLGQNVSKVRSLKLDERVWTDDLIRVFLLLGNGKANQFWGANIPPSESLCSSANSEKRLEHITAKYKDGKYRKYHILYGQQEALNSALCSAVQSGDLLETLSLLNCGADINCNTGIPELPTPLSLAKRSGQTVQAELLMQNLSTESFTRVDKDVSIRSQCGYLFKTASSARPITDHKTKADFTQRWCSLNDGMFNYFKSEQSHNKCGGMKTSEIICVSVNSPGKHGYEYTFELYSEEGRVYLFGSDDGSIVKNWIRTIAMVLLEDNVQTIDLRKLVTLNFSDSAGSMVLVWRGGPLHLLADRRPHFVGWQTFIQQRSGAGDQPLSQQQLTEVGVPVTVDRCLDHITRNGLMSSGIYRKSGINSRVTKLLERFQNDARSVTMLESDYSVDDMANTLKRFLREVKDGVFNGQENSDSWLRAAGLKDRGEKVHRYQILLSNLPEVNRETLKALIHHLVCVQHLSDENQMTIRNLGIVFGPTLFQTDGKDVTGSQVVEELIQNYCSIFNVSESDLQRQLNMTSEILNKHKSQRPLSRTPSSTICAVYLEKIDEGAEVLVQIAADMTVVKLVSVVLELKGIQQANEEFWSCYEVLEKDKMERTLHYQERVLPIYFSLSCQSHLLIKRNHFIFSIMRFLEDIENLCKSGPLRVCEFKNESSKNFHTRHCELSGTTFKLHKELQGSPCEREYPVKELKLYHGCRSKLHPPTPWGLTLIHDKQQWYLCCENEDELTEWTATFYSIQYNGDIWPSW